MRFHLRTIIAEKRVVYNQGVSDILSKVARLFVDLPTSESPSQWPAELDAVIASERHHRLVMENESVRVLETIIPPGETTHLHTHIWPAATYFLSCSDMVRRDEKGKVLMDSRTLDIQRNPGEAAWTPILGPHTLENVGDQTIHVITVEVKPQGA